MVSACSYSQQQIPQALTVIHMGETMTARTATLLVRSAASYRSAIPSARPLISSGKSSDTTSHVTGPNPKEYEATAQHTETRATEVCVEVR